MKQKYNQTKVLNIRMPEELLEWLDAMVDGKIYNSRSEVVRSLIREYVTEK